MSRRWSRRLPSPRTSSSPAPGSAGAAPGGRGHGRLGRARDRRSGGVSIAREPVDRLGAHFLRGDVEAVLAEFTESEDVVYAGSEVGEVAAGRTALRSLLTDLLGRSERYSWTA